MSAPNDRQGPQIFLVLLALVGFLALVGGVSHLDERDGDEPPVRPEQIVPQSRALPAPLGGGLRAPAPAVIPAPPDAPAAPTAVAPELPGGGTEVFADG